MRLSFCKNAPVHTKSQRECAACRREGGAASSAAPAAVVHAPAAHAASAAVQATVLEAAAGREAPAPSQEQTGAADKENCDGNVGMEPGPGKAAKNGSRVRKRKAPQPSVDEYAWAQKGAKCEVHFAGEFWQAKILRVQMKHQSSDGGIVPLVPHCPVPFHAAPPSSRCMLGVSSVVPGKLPVPERAAYKVYALRFCPAWERQRGRDADVDRSRSLAIWQARGPRRLRRRYRRGPASLRSPTLCAHAYSGGR